MREIFITDKDTKRLRQLLENAPSRSLRDQQYLEKLSEELDRAHQVSPQDIPQDVVTMNSRVRVKDLDSNEKMILTLVFPAQADYDRGKVSILAPIGTALIGYRTGDVIEWEVPSGIRRLKIESVLYQPEAAGEFDL